MKYYYKKRKKNNKINPIPIMFIGIGLYKLTKEYLYIYLFIVLPVIIILTLYINKFIKKKRKKNKYLNSGISIVDRLSGIEFEEFLLAHFENLNYKGELTPSTNDYGADLILKKDGEKIVVQAKRYSSKVGIEAIQQIIGAKEYYKATKCMVITNNFYTPNAVNLATSSNVELWDRNKLIEIMLKSNSKEKFVQSLGERIEDVRTCKICDNKMILKNGRYGDFYGCSNYPQCTYTEK